MSQSLTCTEVADLGLVERYLAKRLAPEELELFEAHLMTCPDCQRDIRLAVALRRECARA